MQAMIPVIRATVVAALMLASSCREGDEASPPPAQPPSPASTELAHPEHPFRLRIPLELSYSFHGGRIMLADRADPGAFVRVDYLPGLIPAEVQQRARAPIREPGMALVPDGAPGRLDGVPTEHISAQLMGQMTDGSPARASAVWLVGRPGAVRILGVASPRLAERVRDWVGDIAASVEFLTK